VMSPNITFMSFLFWIGLFLNLPTPRISCIKCQGKNKYTWHCKINKFTWHCNQTLTFLIFFHHSRSMLMVPLFQFNQHQFASSVISSMQSHHPSTCSIYIFFSCLFLNMNLIPWWSLVRSNECLAGSLF
jgi:hypothetical protein